jgi:hypothetical protein
MMRVRWTFRVGSLASFAAGCGWLIARASPKRLAHGTCPQRGFAMPLVVLLALVVGIVAAVVLQRQTSQSLIVERQLRSYQTTHFERGLREVVGAWTDTLVGQPLDVLIGDGGHALDLDFPDGSWASVYLFDGQGSLLSTPAGLTQQQVADVAGVIEKLGVITGGDVDPAWFRPVGPVRVSIPSAPPELLEAIAEYAGSRAARRLVTSLLESRQRGEVTQPDLESAYNAGNLNPEQRAVMNRLVALRPELWAMVVEVYEPGRPGEGDVLKSRFLGRFILPTGGGARPTGSLTSLGKFLSWEELPLD